MYNYQVQKKEIFTDTGQRKFLKVRDRVNNMLDSSGAFKMSYAWKNITDDSFTMLAYVDRLVELGEIREITGNDVSGQDRVFVRR